MDFFANAFQTRDITDEDHDTIVSKDGIHIREKEAPPILSANGTDGDIVLCEICGVVTAKYKCPGCFCQTCSLKCSKQHKADTTCSGVRSRTHFVDRKVYSEKDMMSDYNFLEEVGRTVDNAARENVKLDAGTNSNRKKHLTGGQKNHPRNRTNRNHNKDEGHDQEGATVSDLKPVEALALTAAQELEKLGAEGSGSYKDKQMILQAKKRGTHLIMMADGLKKRKENCTHWRDKPSRIIWTTEWLFPEVDGSRRVLEHKSEESKVLKDILSAQMAREENQDLAKRYPSDVLEQCRLYFVIPLRHANKPALYPLRNLDTLQEAFQFKKVLEYPTILVLGPSPSSDATLSSETTTTSSSTSSTATTTTTETTTNASTASSSSKAAPSETTLETVSTSSSPAEKILSKYTIEEPPTELPKKLVPPTQSNNNNNKNNNTHKKRPLAGEDAEAAVATNKKTKVDEAKVESGSDSDSDSEDDSDDSDSDDSSSEDSEDESSEDEADTTKEEDGKDKDVAMLEAEEEEEEEKANLAIGQAIMEAFNQDFASLPDEESK